MTLRLQLELKKLGDQTHVWFPVPKLLDGFAPADFSIPPRTVGTEKKFQNAFVYYCLGNKEAMLSMTIEGAGDRGGDAPADREVMSSYHIQSADRNIRRIAHELVRASRSTEEKAARCFNWVVDYLVYDNPIRGLYSSLQALTDRHVDCGGFATLYVALLRSLGIPARCAFGWAKQSKSGYHAWAEHYDEAKKTWIPSDPSVAHLGKRTNLRAGFGFIDDPRITVSVGENLMLEGENIRWGVPLFQTPIVVSLRDGVPRSFEERLSWGFLL